MKTIEEQKTCLNLITTMNKLINLLYPWVLHILVCNYKFYYDNQKIWLIQIYNLTYFVIIQMKHFDEILVFIIKMMSPISPAIY